MAPGFGDVLTLATLRTDDPIAGVTVPAPGGQGPAAGQLSHLREIQAEPISRQFPRHRARGFTGAAPAAAADYENYIRAHSTVRCLHIGATSITRR